jgi:aspartate-semialdehyde dehydrogenase
MSSFNVAVVGPTDLIGTELLRVLAQRRFPINRIKFLDGAGGAVGRKINFAGKDFEVTEVGTRAFKDVDISFFCGNQEVTQHFASVAAENKGLAIDLNGAFRTDDKTLIIVPEINPEDLQTLTKRRIVANPSAATIQATIPLNTLRQWSTINRLFIHTFEPVSQSGQSAVELFSAEVKQVIEGKNVVPHLYQHQIAFNMLPETENFMDSGLSRGEARLIREIRRLWRSPELKIIATSIRVPLYNGMSQSIQADFSRPINAEEAREVIGDTPGVHVVDDPAVSLYPHPWQTVNQDNILVGRVHEVDPTYNSLALWSTMDNIRRGGAINAIAIAESAIEQKIV